MATQLSLPGCANCKRLEQITRGEVFCSYSAVPLFIGIAIGAGIHGYVPEDFLADIMGSEAWLSNFFDPARIQTRSLGGPAGS